MNYTEDDFLPLSALQHLLFCKRQCALIHIEQAWVENLFTAEGRIMHERVDAGGQASRGDVRVEYGVPLRSLRLGVTGKADVVEFHRKAGTGETKRPMWQPFPVEYKRGKPKKDNYDKVQLCAQAMCLEEMLDVETPCGALFYGKTRRRQDVVFDHALRLETENAAEELHKLFESGLTPKPAYDKEVRQLFVYQYVADRLTLSLINLSQVVNDGFNKSESGAVLMDDETRKTVLVAYQKRKQDEIMHPFLEEKVPVGMLFYIQALLMSRYLRGDLDGYPAFIWK